MPDATVIPIGGDDGARKAASRAARQAGATGPRPKAKRPVVAPEPTPQTPPVDDDAHDVDGSPTRLDENIAEWLDFLRRRVTGDYEVDEFGFDAELTDRVVHGAAAAALRQVVPGRDARHRERARRSAARSSSPTTRARSRSTR